MKFGAVAPADAVGAILAHSLKTSQGRLKKGHVLSSQDAANLAEAGFEHVTVARLEPGDVGENIAAQSVAEALKGTDDQAIVTAPPGTGRVNLHASATGLFTVSKTQIDAVNAIDPGITVATLADGTWVEDGRMVATVKIIPFAVAEQSVKAVITRAFEGRGMNVHACRPLRVGLVATQLSVLKPSVMDKTARVLSDRLALSRSRLVKELRTEHKSQSVADGLLQLSDACDLLIVFGASAIVDKDDVIPDGIRKAGGDVLSFGMPVDPGNLLLIGALAGKPVIGAPGCARSPAENGFDWALQRLVCGLPVDGAYLSRLGVGGLLMEITSRPHPREATST